MGADKKPVQYVGCDTSLLFGSAMTILRCRMDRGCTLFESSTLSNELIFYCMVEDCSLTYLSPTDDNTEPRIEPSKSSLMKVDSFLAVFSTYLVKSLSETKLISIFF